MAMNEKEIRIGNIVSCFYRNEKVVEVIRSIWYDSIEKSYNVEFDSGHFSGTKGISINGIMPIPITKELYNKIEEENKDMTIPSIYVAHSLDWLQNMAYFINGKELKIERGWL